MCMFAYGGQRSNPCIVSQVKSTLVFEPGSLSGLELAYCARPVSLRDPSVSVSTLPVPHPTSCWEHSHTSPQLDVSAWVLEMNFKPSCFQGKHFTFFFLRFILFILCIWVHCSCLQTHQKKESDPITDGCEPPCGGWELNSGPLGSSHQSGKHFTDWAICAIVLNKLGFKKSFRFMVILGKGISHISSPQPPHYPRSPPQW
jgi:hypothetical protein